jgi:branched-chain amino acid aminotransferase
MRKVYLNGNFVDEIDAKVSIYDSALQWGDMVFEATRSFNKKQFKLREHLERLYKGIKILEIPMKIGIDELEEICHETVNINEPFFNENDEHRLIIEVSRGPLGIYSPIFKDKMEPTVIVADFPLKFTVSYMSKYFKTGINCVVTNQKAIPSRYLDSKMKHRNRMFYQMANIEASKFSGNNNWALLLDENNFVAEGSGNNFFIIKDKKIITPKGKDILRGISRNYIFELAEQLNLECVEDNFETFDIYEAQEAFVTATPFCILPVTSLNSLKIGKGEMGDITKQLLKKWSENVNLDIKKQMDDYSIEVDEILGNAPTPLVFNPKK